MLKHINLMLVVLLNSCQVGLTELSPLDFELLLFNHMILLHLPHLLLQLLDDILIVFI